MKIEARQLMTTGPITVFPETPLIDVHRLFVEEEIHGAPVVDEERGVVQGIITSADLLRAVMQEHESGGSSVRYLREMVEYSGPDWQRMPEDFQDRLEQLRVEDFMTPDVVTVPPDAPIREIARAMRANRVHRVLVIEDGVLVGVISALDLVGALDRES